MATDQLERECWAAGKLLCGVDEAGYGCLAGSLHVASVVFPANHDFSTLKGLNDSKKISDQQRFQLEPLIKQTALWWSCESATAAEIDAAAGTDRNVYWMRFELAERAINFFLSENPVQTTLVMDGNKALRIPGADSRFLVQGDAKCLTIAAASVLAKCAKNREMAALHEQHPEYGWDRNNGYWKADHVAAIEKLGFTDYHRRSYCSKIKQPTHTIVG